MAEDNVHNQDETEDLELACISSLRTKLPPYSSVLFYYCTLEDALNSITSSPLDERKMLLLYLHSSNDPFSKTFVQQLQVKDKLSEVLRRSYLVVGWDLDDQVFHEHLVSVLNRYPILSSVSEYITKQVAAAFCILPYDGSINLASCLKNARLTSIIASLEGVEKLYEEHMKVEAEESASEAQTSSDNGLTPEKMQGIWADMLGNRDYDCLEHNEHEALKDKIGFALKGPPLETTGYNAKEKIEIEKLYQQIKKESSKIAKCKDRVEMAVFYACLVPLPEEKLAKSKKYPDYNPINDWTPLPVFRLRKCRIDDTKDQNERLPCVIIIDHTGRVYQNWTSYLTNNKYPKGLMVVPKNGRYRCNSENSLEYHLTPACGIKKKLLAAGDVTSMVASLGSATVCVGATIPALAALPVLGPPVLVGAAVTGGIGVLWTLGRTICNLVDRSKHEEELKWANSEARGAYLNIMACTLGFVGAGSNVLLSQLISRGFNVGKGAAFAFNSISVVNLGASGASLGNSAYDMWERFKNDKELPSKLALLQLSASVLFFAHAASNFKTAQTVIDETQMKVLQNHQDLLRSNRHRKTFNKLLKETIRVQGDETKGMTEVILLMRKIPDKNEVFAALTRNNKLLNKKGVKFASNNGEIYFNDMKVDMNQFMGLSGKQTENFLVNLGQEPVPLQNNSLASPSLKLAVTNVLSDFKIDVSTIDVLKVVNLTVGVVGFLNADVRVKIVDAVHQALDYYLLKYGRGLIEIIDKILPKDTQYMQVLNVGISYFRGKVDELEEQYQQYQKTGDQKHYCSIFDKVNPEKIKRIITFFEKVVKNAYSSAKSLIHAVVEEIATFIHSWFAGIIFEQSEKEAKENEVKEYTKYYKVSKNVCEVCEGHYFKPIIYKRTLF